MRRNPHRFDTVLRGRAGIARYRDPDKHAGDLVPLLLEERRRDSRINASGEAHKYFSIFHGSYCPVEVAVEVAGVDVAPSWSRRSRGSSTTSRKAPPCSSTASSCSSSAGCIGTTPARLDTNELTHPFVTVT